MMTIGIDRGVRSGSFCFLVLVGVACLALACGDSAPKAGDEPRSEASVVVARIGSEVVTTDELGYLGPRADGKLLLDAVIRRKLAIAEARRRGLENEPKFRANLEEIRRNAERQEEVLLRNALFNSIRLGLKLSEEEVLAHYEKTKDRYVERQWALRTQDFPSEDAALAALGANGRLDPAHSVAPGPVPAEQLPNEILLILHELEQPGDRRLLPLDRWTIVELEAYLPTAQIPFETVREKVDLSLRAIRAEDLMRAEIDRLRIERKVEVDDAALAAWVAKQTENRAAAAAAPAP